jgi:hypothetical protein
LEVCAPSVSKQFASDCENLGGIKFDFANPNTLKTARKPLVGILTIFEKK